MGKLHFQNSLRSKNVKVVAIADADKSNLKVTNQYKINTYTDYKKMIDVESIDAVIISLPNFLKKKVFCIVSKKVYLFS